LNIEELKNSIIEDIRRTCKDRDVVIAFSGGMDSTLVAFLTIEALGKDRVDLVNVCFGPFSYSNSVAKVLEISSKLGKRVTFLKGKNMQLEIWKHGPSCNLCTKKIKFGLVGNYAQDRLILGGANKSDSWGQYGIKLSGNSYSPLFDLNKGEITELLKLYGIDSKKLKIGENRSSSGREGCKLKHLLKMLAVPKYHGKAVALSNELLLDFLQLKGVDYSMANVKIIGPLGKNIALVNVFPYLNHEDKEEFRKLLLSIDVIDDVHFVEKPLVLFAKVNPGIFIDEKARYWLEAGRLQKEFAAPIKVEWSISKNNKLRTFHIVNFQEVESF